ncbi:MAG: SseB family protein [Oscillospiraceae bacterium]|nr:SseB family protein [Oscillospiraceae bacterium]
MKRSLMKDGKMLRECIEQYKYYSSGNNQMVVYTCLRDSRVFVPWRAGRVNDMAFLRENGKRYLPAFSNVAQMGDKAGNLEVEEKDFLDVITAARFANVDGILVDPYTIPFLVEPGEYDTISRMITRITSEN